MTAYTDFHYSPTGSGVISGAQVLEQTEQGINGLGQYVQDNVSGAIDVANEALTTAQSADSNATTAINLANSLNAQIIAANQTAGNALTTAQSAQNTANAASSLATTANNNAATALNTANSASAGVTTLTGTVNSLGNRMTAAENAINTNAGNITTLQNGLATTNANVTAAANAASAAQATATSAQATATSAKNAAYVLRYTGTIITGGGTIAYADIDNTDNIKAGDKIIDATGAVYAIASVDIANETVTVSASEIINLAVLPNLFNSANTWTALNSYNQSIQITANFSIGAAPSSDVYGGFNFGNGNTNIGNVTARVSSAGITYSRLYVSNKYANGALDPNGTLTNVELQVGLKANGNRFIYSNASWDNSLIPYANNTYDLGSSSYQWNNLYAKNYYYNGTQWGLDKSNVWSAWQTIERTNVESLLRLRRTDLKIGEGASNQNIGTLTFAGSDDLNFGLVGSRDFSGGDTQLILLARQKYDANNDRSTNGTQKETRVEIGINTPSNKYFRPNSNGDVDLGTSTNKWKTLNGINPGALSLPSGATENINTDNWNFSWSANTITAPFDGYISIACFGSALQINNETKSYAMTYAPGSDGFICGLLPVSFGDSIKVLVTRTQTSIYEGYKFIKASGNVS